VTKTTQVDLGSGRVEALSPYLLALSPLLHLLERRNI
jgi:hypothetical protein